MKKGFAEIKLKLDEEPIGYIEVKNNNVETTKKVIDPVLSDSVQPCSVDIKVGEIVGWPGNDGVAKKYSFHFEVFTKNDKIFGNDGFWNITSTQGKPDGTARVSELQNSSSQKVRAHLDKA